MAIKEERERWRLLSWVYLPVALMGVWQKRALILPLICRVSRRVDVFIARYFYHTGTMADSASCSEVQLTSAFREKKKKKSTDFWFSDVLIGSQPWSIPAIRYSPDESNDNWKNNVKCISNREYIYIYMYLYINMYINKYSNKVG